jgi:high-affinity Fe2+/Pb2+ permease
MRSRRTMSNDGMGLMPVIGIAVAVLIVASAIGFTIYGGSVQPVTRHFEQVVPDDRLPH